MRAHGTILVSLAIFVFVSAVLSGCNGSAGGPNGIVGTVGAAPTSTQTTTSPATPPPPPKQFPMHHTDAVQDFYFSADGTTFESVGVDGWVLVWDMKTRTVIDGTKLFNDEPASPSCAFFLDQGRLVLGGSFANWFCWDVATGAQIWGNLGGENVKVNADGTGFTINTGRGIARVDPRTGTITSLFDYGSNMVVPGPGIVGAAVCGGFSLYQGTSLVNKVPGTDDNFVMFTADARFSNDGRFVAAWANELFWTFDGATGALLQFKGKGTNDPRTADCVFSPDDRTIAQNTMDDDQSREINLLDEATLQTLATIPGQSSGNYSVMKFSPDGKTLITGHGNDVMFWDVSKITGRP